MTYRLNQLAPGSYDLLLNGEIIGSVVRSGSRGNDITWTAELLLDSPEKQRPKPFIQAEKTFKTLEEVCARVSSNQASSPNWVIEGGRHP
jgi:hypothetical protein